MNPPTTSAESLSKKTMTATPRLVLVPLTPGAQALLTRAAEDGVPRAGPLIENGGGRVFTATAQPAR